MQYGVLCEKFDRREYGRFGHYIIIVRERAIYIVNNVVLLLKRASITCHIICII